MSKIQAMRAFTENLATNPYISPTRLERVTKCFELYQDSLSLGSLRQTSNILKRLQLTSETVSNNLISKHPGQFVRVLSTETDTVPFTKNTDMQALKILKGFEQFRANALSIFIDGMKIHGPV